MGFPWDCHGNGNGNGNDFRGSGNVEKYILESSAECEFKLKEMPTV